MRAPAISAVRHHLPLARAASRISRASGMLARPKPMRTWPGSSLDRAGKQEDAGLGEACAVSGEVTDSGHAGESDGACGRAYPLEGLGVPLEEGVEQRQVVLHDGKVAVEQDVAVAERQRGQELARRARADRGVVLQDAGRLPQAGISGGQPPDPQARQAVALGDAPKRNGRAISVPVGLCGWLRYSRRVAGRTRPASAWRSCAQPSS